jgi:hypothetical protein
MYIFEFARLSLVPLKRITGGAYNRLMATAVDEKLQAVLDVLSQFEHPLLDFSAHAHGEGVQLIINAKNVTVPVHTYYFDLHPRDLDHPQLAWTLQRQLYDCLHDYFIEMFIRAPHTK